MQKICVINAVGLTQKLLSYAPSLASQGESKAWRSPVPAVTCTSQATMLTGLKPREHGIVANGWYFRDTAEIRFWQQSNSLIQCEKSPGLKSLSEKSLSGKSLSGKLYEGVETAKMFWWFNQNAPVRWSATPKPHYGCDGSKAFGILDRTDCQLEQSLGAFPFASFWGPNAGLPSTDWIARATARVMRKNRPQLTLTYLPHLDYDFQRFSEPSMERVKELDQAASIVIDAAQDIGAKVIVVSEYGLVPVSRTIAINRELRKAGWLTVRNGPYGEQLMPGESKVFAVVDHQVAHIYIQDPGMQNEVKSFLESLDGIDRVVFPEAIDLDHPRSGELIALAKPDAWFNYYFWLDDRNAPDYARTIDIHRKPGYDPAELFMTSMPRAMFRLAQKKLGFRYRMDVIPLDTSLVRGSHGLGVTGQDGPLIIGPNPPEGMCEFKTYIRGLF